MKKLLIALAFAGFSMSSMAQEADPTLKYSVATNSFWSNWFIQVGVDWNAWYSNEEHGLGLARSPFKDFRSNPGASIAIGKWFTPGIGLRTKLSGIWGKAVTDDNNDGNCNKYWTLNEHVLFNLSNMLCGYNPNRVWNFIPYAGVGAIHNFDSKKDNFTLNLGLLNNFRISDRWQVFADLSIAAADGNFDGIGGNWLGHSQLQSGHWDKKLALDLGVTYNFSWKKNGTTTWNQAPDVDALMAMNKEQIDALNQSIKEQQDENAKLRQMLAASSQKPAPVCENKKEFACTDARVFLDINSAKVASRNDLVNVKELAEYAKANNAKIVVTGYADSKTGSAEYNQQLSQKRANTVADELVKMGVNRDNIITEAKGGVDNLSPFSYNRRATVKVQ